MSPSCVVGAEGTARGYGNVQGGVVGPCPALAGWGKTHWLLSLSLSQDVPLFYPTSAISYKPKPLSGGFALQEADLFQLSTRVLKK